MSAADDFREARRQNEVIADAFAKAVAGFARLVRERQGIPAPNVIYAHPETPSDVVEGLRAFPKEEPWKP